VKCQQNAGLNRSKAKPIAQRNIAPELQQRARDCRLAVPKASAAVEHPPCVGAREPACVGRRRWPAPYAARGHGVGVGVERGRPVEAARRGSKSVRCG